MIWSNLFTSLLLCTTTRVWKFRQLQSRSFISIKLKKVPRPKLIRLKWKKNKKTVCQSRLLVDEILSCRRIKLSNSQTSSLDGVNTGVLHSDFAQQLLRENADVPDTFITLLHAAGISPTLVLNQNANTKKRSSATFSENKRQKLRRLYTQSVAVYASVRNSVKTSNLPAANVRQFLHSKPSYTKFTFATRKFKRMETFARFKNEIWCMNIAYVDKLAKSSNGVKYLLSRIDVFLWHRSCKRNEKKRFHRNG